MKPDPNGGKAIIKDGALVISIQVDAVLGSKLTKPVGRAKAADSARQGLSQYDSTVFHRNPQY